MSDDLRTQIYHQMNLKETAELAEIWRANDRTAWTDTAFEVIQEILLERLGKLPPQEKAIGKPGGEEANGPVFYKPGDVLWLDAWLNRAASITVVIAILGNLLALPIIQRAVLALFMGNSISDSSAWLIAIVMVSLIILFQSLIVYFSLKALSSILRILMEMEFNSRGAKKRLAVE